MNSVRAKIDMLSGSVSLWAFMQVVCKRHQLWFTPELINLTRNVPVNQKLKNWHFGPAARQRSWQSPIPNEDMEEKESLQNCPFSVILDISRNFGTFVRWNVAIVSSGLCTVVVLWHSLNVRQYLAPKIPLTTVLPARLKL
jgi:hypothetical protein